MRTASLLSMMLVRLSDSVYARVGRELSSANDSNRGYIVCEEYVVVVDTTHHLESMKEELKSKPELLDLPRLIDEIAVQKSIEQNNVEVQYDLL